LGNMSFAFFCTYPRDPGHWTCGRNATC
jgi:hypothetical protein